MKTLLHTLFLGLAIVIMVIAPAAAPASAATKEQVYDGQLMTLIAIGGATLEDISDLTSNYTGTAEWNMDAIAICRVWAYLDDAAQDLDPGESREDRHDIVLSLFGHLRLAGEYLETAILTNDPGFIELATVELAAATDDVKRLQDEIGL